MAYASHMQFEVLRRALWVQQAQPQTVFTWQFWERAAQDPKTTSYLTHGVKAKMCETTPFVNAVGARHVASRAQIEQACDCLRQQGNSKVSTIGLSKVDVCASTTLTEFPSCTIAEALLVPKIAIWSAIVMHTSLVTLLLATEHNKRKVEKRAENQISGVQDRPFIESIFVWILAWLHFRHCFRDLHHSGSSSSPSAVIISEGSGTVEQMDLKKSSMAKVGLTSFLSLTPLTFQKKQTKSNTSSLCRKTRLKNKCLASFQERPALVSSA